VDTQFLEFHFGVQPIGKGGHKSLAGRPGRERQPLHDDEGCSRDSRNRNNCGGDRYPSSA